MRLVDDLRKRRGESRRLYRFTDFQSEAFPREDAGADRMQRNGVAAYLFILFLIALADR